MNIQDSHRFQASLSEKLSDSLSPPLPTGTPRQVFGAVRLPGKATAPETAERELRALVAAGDRYPDAQKLLLTLTRDGMPANVTDGVTVQPAYSWLLATPSTS